MADERRALIESIRGEFQRYKKLAEGAIDQLPDNALCVEGSDGSNSIATLCWHISGNLQSRFTEFLTTDGEKPWRQREEEFRARTVTRQELLSKWEQGWRVLFHTLDKITDNELSRTVTIRNQPSKVHEALHRSLSHTSYHVGQIVYIAKSLRGDAWTSLSIPRGKSDEFNQKMMRPLQVSPRT